MGTIVTLHDCIEEGFYTGGLDVSSNTDGEFSLLWKGDMQQIMFHVATLMPNIPQDKNFTNKKRYIIIAILLLLPLIFLSAFFLSNILGISEMITVSLSIQIRRAPIIKILSR